MMTISPLCVCVFCVEFENYLFFHSHYDRPCAKRMHELHSVFVCAHVEVRALR